MVRKEEVMDFKSRGGFNWFGRGGVFWYSQPHGSRVSSKERRDERPAKLFQQANTRKNKDATIIPPPGSNTLNDTIMPSDDSPKTNLKVHDLSPLTSKTATLNPHDDEKDRRNPFHDRKEPDRLSFSKSSSNVVNPISDFVSYHHLSKTHLAFALQLSFVFIPSHF